jgi:hypothetical protein
MLLAMAQFTRSRSTENSIVVVGSLETVFARGVIVLQVGQVFCLGFISASLPCAASFELGWCETRVGL